MTAPSPGAAVVASYTWRARFARAETAAVARPRLLRGLLDSATHVATHVAEIPCGAGHFLADYARAGATVSLVDASPAMLDIATEHALDVGLPTERTFPTLAFFQDLTLRPDVDLVVAPNAALNQLTCQAPLTELLSCLRAGLGPGAEVLAQVACTHPGAGVDTATFYDVTRQHGVWFADRWFDPARAEGAVCRRRRQHRHRDRLRIEFDYLDTAGASLHATTVELALLRAARLAQAFTTAGFGHVRFLPGQGGLSEVLATTHGARR